MQEHPVGTHIVLTDLRASVTAHDLWAAWYKQVESQGCSCISMHGKDWRKAIKVDSWGEVTGRKRERGMWNRRLGEKYSWVKENKMEGCNREVIVKAGWRQIAQWACFLLMRIRFHKDPHDCLITRGAQRGMRRRGKAGHDETDKQQFALLTAAFFVLLIFSPQWTHFHASYGSD